MKIEMGESLILSWLRHIKKCQSVQINWKPSTNHWTLSNEDNIELMMTTVNDYYEEKYGFKIFKNNKSYLQLLLQGELDAFGLQIEDGIITNMYGVDVAFHESGLNYGDKNSTIERVIKKLVRTSMLFNGYFNMRKGKIIFASPKINKSINEPLLYHLEELRGLYESMDFQFEFEVIANQDFKNQILDPVISIASSVADTSELFLRSIQMNQMFNNNEVTPLKTKTTSKQMGDDMGINTSEQKIGAFVQRTFSDLISSDGLHREKLVHLCDARYSKTNFLLPYPMLKRVVAKSSILEQRKIKGEDRYYSEPLAIHGEKYLFCNYWIEKSRRPYKVWLDSIMNKNIGE